jgi:hypothetical protein
MSEQGAEGGHANGLLRLTGTVTIAPGAVGMRVDHSTLLGGGRGSGYGVMVCPAEPPEHCDDTSITHNRFVGRFDEDAIRALARDASVQLSGANNTRCGASAGMDAIPGTGRDCSPHFANPKAGDYRQRGGRGVRWRLSQKHFGPG